MNFIKYLPLIILLFFTLKFLISYIEKSTYFPRSKNNGKTN